jgi:membrane protein
MASVTATGNKLSFSTIKRLLVETYNEWSKDQAPRLGASLAYYTILSLAPLLVLLIALAGFVFGEEAARGQLFGEIRGLVGSEGAEAIQSMVNNAAKGSGGIIASILGFLTLIFGASSVAGELKASLNAIWDKPPDPEAGITTEIKQRSYALVVVLACGFLLLVSLTVSSAIAAGGRWLAGLLPLPEALLHGLNFVLSLLVITAVFAALFKFLPDVDIRWRDVFLGAAFTAILFGLGKFAIGLYLGKASFGSTYGAAGSLVIVLVWVYYSSQLLFFGAEFTQVYAQHRGSDPMRKRQQGPVASAHSAEQRQKLLPDSMEPARVNPEVSSAAQSNAAVAANGTQSGILAAVGVVLGSVLAATKAGRVLKSR